MHETLEHQWRGKDIESVGPKCGDAAVGVDKSKARSIEPRAEIRVACTKRQNHQPRESIRQVRADPSCRNRPERRLHVIRPRRIVERTSRCIISRPIRIAERDRDSASVPLVYANGGHNEGNTRKKARVTAPRSDYVIVFSA